MRSRVFVISNFSLINLYRKNAHIFELLPKNFFSKILAIDFTYQNCIKAKYKGVDKTFKKIMQNIKCNRKKFDLRSLKVKVGILKI